MCRRRRTVWNSFDRCGLLVSAHVVAASFYRGGEVVGANLATEDREAYYRAENKAVDLINADFRRYAHHIVVQTKGVLEPHELLPVFMRYKHVDYYEPALFTLTYDWMKARRITDGASEHDSLVAWLSLGACRRPESIECPRIKCQGSGALA